MGCPDGFITDSLMRLPYNDTPTNCDIRLSVFRGVMTTCFVMHLVMQYVLVSFRASIPAVARRKLFWMVIGISSTTQVFILVCIHMNESVHRAAAVHSIWGLMTVFITLYGCEVNAIYVTFIRSTRRMMRYRTFTKEGNILTLLHVNSTVSLVVLCIGVPMAMEYAIPGITAVGIHMSGCALMGVTTLTTTFLMLRYSVGITRSIIQHLDSMPRRSQSSLIMVVRDMKTRRKVFLIGGIFTGFIWIFHATNILPVSYWMVYLHLSYTVAVVWMFIRVYIYQGTRRRRPRVQPHLVPQQMDNVMIQ